MQELLFAICFFGSLVIFNGRCFIMLERVSTQIFMCGESVVFRYYVMRKHVVEKVLRLTSRKEKYLVVAAVRFLRTCISLKVYSEPLCRLIVLKIYICLLSEMAFYFSREFIKNLCAELVNCKNFLVGV